MQMVEKIEKKESRLLNILMDERVQIGILLLSLLTIPFVLDKSQYLTGTLVNTLLALGIVKFGLKKVWPMILLPSASTYLHGIIFGGATNFLIYLIPFIVLANLIYSLLFKNIKKDILNVLIASFVKAGFLFIVAYFLYRTIGLPELFLTTMGVMQLVTALSGGFIAYTVIKQFRSFFN